jgi:hypothetical protein
MCLLGILLYEAAVLSASGFGLTLGYCCGLLHACLQTSCCVVQFSVHGAVPAGLEVLVVGPTVTQAFWQFMTCVSQLTRQAVDVCDDINGVRVSGTGWTCPGVGFTTCASRIRSAPKAVELAMAASKIESCTTYLIESSIGARQLPSSSQA